MKLILQDPVGGQIPIDAETCPRKGERVLIKGRKYVVTKIYHEAKPDENLPDRLITIVEVRLFTVDDLIDQSES